MASRYFSEHRKLHHPDEEKGKSMMDKSTKKKMEFMMDKPMKKKMMGKKMGKKMY